MASDNTRKVPTGRLARLVNIGGLAGNVMTNVIADRVKDLSRGDKRSYGALVLQPKNIKALADKLSHLRGAAMKLGQLLSMDAGELLPPELSGLLEQLRNKATPMPHKQLIGVMESELGKNWIDNFSYFDLRPFAAASIGQVHKATLADGRQLAVKVQYPGIANSINSDVDNVATLLAVSRLIPKEVDLVPTLEEVKRQLNVEADYKLEAKHLKDFYSALQHRKDITVPKVYDALTTQHIITMEYLEGMSLASCAELDQSHREHIISTLLALFFEELFEFRQMQSDPNFANYLYDPITSTIQLLDFGATRDIPLAVSEGYRQLLSAATNNNKQQVIDAAKAIGFFQDDIPEQQIETVVSMFMLATTPLRCDYFDFGESELASQIKDMGLELSMKQGYWHTPPVDAMFIHRKLAGLYLIAARLEVKVPVQQLFAPYLTD